MSFRAFWFIFVVLVVVGGQEEIDSPDSDLDERAANIKKLTVDFDI